MGVLAEIWKRLFSKLPLFILYLYIFALLLITHDSIYPLGLDIRFMLIATKLYLDFLISMIYYRRQLPYILNISHCIHLQFVVDMAIS